MNALMFYGRRVERLLYLGLVLMVITYADVFITKAVRNLEGDPIALAMNDLLVYLRTNKADLDKLYLDSQRAPLKYQALRDHYANELHSAISRGTLRNFNAYYNAGVHTTIDAELAKLIDFNMRPDEIIGDLQRRLTERSRGTKLLNVEVPSLIKIQMGGGEYQLPIQLVSASLTILLAPLLLLWVGALYVTRYREIFLILTTSNVGETFPHVLNILPATLNKAATKRHNYRLARGLAIYSALAARLFLVFLFLGGLLVPYIYGVSSFLELQGDVFSEELTIWHICFAIALFIVAIQSLGLVFLEFFLALSKKSYNFDMPTG